ncbi:MAG TPA: energy-coupling factor transporter transmembrane component T [Planctomycetaceae bacterium]|nr:energy-coupling factor transporter transmembrane component T [Planctomycetaceae bacterium]
MSTADSPLPKSRPSSEAKLGFVLALLVTAGLLPGEQWPAVALLAVVAYLAHAVAGTASTVLWRRGRQFAIVAVVMGSAGLMSRLDADSAVAMGALLLRMTVAFLAGLWLMQVMTAAELIRVLRRWHFPPALIAILSSLLRYVVVLWEEHERLLRAQQSRAGGTAAGWASWIAAVHRLGLLLLRGIDRAERTHRAMIARGWDGTERWLS